MIPLARYAAAGSPGRGLAMLKDTGSNIPHIPHVSGRNRGLAASRETVWIL
jgi:hypothetical protein